MASGSRTLDDKIGSEDTHGSDTDTRLGGTVGGTETGEDDGAGAAHSTEEGLEMVSYVDLDVGSISWTPWKPGEASRVTSEHG